MNFAKGNVLCSLCRDRLGRFIHNKGNDPHGVLAPGTDQRFSLAPPCPYPNMLHKSFHPPQSKSLLTAKSHPATLTSEKQNPGAGLESKVSCRLKIDNYPVFL